MMRILSIFLSVLMVLLFPSVSSQPTTKFALLTVTYSRGTNNQFLMKYLDYYTHLKCPPIIEINIVWNNPQTPQEMGILKNKNSWIRPVYFYYTPSNSMVHRYRIPHQSQADIFLSIDDDIGMRCDVILKGFQMYRRNVVRDNIGPMVSYHPRHYDFSNEKWKYGQRAKTYYAFGLMGTTFVSRHFLQLFYLDHPKLNPLRQHVAKINNCDDISMNFIVGYFYPELHILLGKGGSWEFVNKHIGQSWSGGHLKNRSICLQVFSEVLGQTPVHMLRLSYNQQLSQRKDYEIIREAVGLKVQYYQKWIEEDKRGVKSFRSGEGKQKQVTMQTEAVYRPVGVVGIDCMALLGVLMLGLVLGWGLSHLMMRMRQKRRRVSFESVAMRVTDEESTS